MLGSTYFQDVVVRQGDAEEAGLFAGAVLAEKSAETIRTENLLWNRELFPKLRKEFLVSQQPLFALKRRSAGDTQAFENDRPVEKPDTLVRLPSLEKSQWKVTVLQRWIGRIEQVKAKTFIAVLNDATSVQNPPEEMEFESAEVSPSDLPLLVPGAIFYWSIGYQDTPGGQRQRVAALRFARQPRLSDAEVGRVFERADRLAAFLEH
ncbi:MAG TPA: hypothetical protein VK686_20610 [Bryobacteraceae bacterium]|jgi:hypothetical protein|nr:hypothetical protein [Bryobacteraceae bacterium]